jgi:hypothetical protein
VNSRTTPMKIAMRRMIAPPADCPVPPMNQTER